MRWDASGGVYASGEDGVHGEGEMGCVRVVEGVREVRWGACEWWRGCVR